MSDKPEKDEPHRDPNQPTPKEPPTKSFGRKLVEVLIAFVVILFVGSIISFSLRINRGPWAWTNEDWQAYLSFSREKLENAKDRVESYDWAHAKTVVTENTKALWDKAPDVTRSIEERLGIKKASPAPGTSPGATSPGGTPAGADTTDSPELGAGLNSMREGIGHYRGSPDDPSELAEAKKCFEDAHGHLERAVVQVKDERQRSQVQEDLKTCNKYLEDCRSREKN